MVYCDPLRGCDKDPRVTIEELYSYFSSANRTVNVLLRTTRIFENLYVFLVFRNF